MQPGQIETFHCWVCDTHGAGPSDLRCHECNLGKFNKKYHDFLDTKEGQFLTYIARKMIASSGSNLPLAKS